MQSGQIIPKKIHMPKETVSIEIHASCIAVFNLIHDYDRRLQWDTMLSRAMLLGDAKSADVGVRSLCVGTWQSGYLGLETEYIRFEPGEVAAIKLTNRPSFFDRFAATIRHKTLSDSRSLTTYIYNFSASPRILSPLLEPIMNVMLKREVTNRLRALRDFLENSPTPL